MVRLVVLLLIALLPLRGWTVAWMALPMNPVVSLEVHAVSSAMPDDCAMHHTGLEKHDSESSKHGCGNCQLCMAMAVLDNPLPLASTPSPSVLPHLLCQTWVSTDPMQAVKPPIS